MGEEVKVNTPLKKSRFKKEGQYLIATMRSGFECKVILDSELNLNQCSQLCPLTEWMDEDEMFADSLSEASDDTSIFDLQEESESIEEEVDLPQWSAFEDDNDLHQAQMTTAWEQAKETKEFPPGIVLESDFHVYFLWRHFTRNSDDEVLAKVDEKKWKKVIRKHLPVLHDRIGKMVCGLYTFSLIPGAKPVRQRMYALSQVKKDALVKMLKVLLANDCIEPCKHSMWMSPIILVSKGGGRWRLVVDYRRLNESIENVPVAYPRPDDIFECVHDAYLIFLIDGRDFYFQ
jgi:hypothetical protein